MPTIKSRVSANLECIQAWKLPSHLVFEISPPDVVARAPVGSAIGHKLCDRVVPVHVQDGARNGPLVGVVCENDIQFVVGAGNKLGRWHLSGDHGSVAQKVETLMIPGGLAQVGWALGGSTIVADDRSRVRVVRVATEAASAKGNIEPVVVDRLAGVNGHVVALANGNEQTVRGVRVDGHQVGCDDGHVMVDKRDLEVVLNAYVEIDCQR